MHGWGCDYKTLMPLINAYKEDYKCLCLDFIGHGKTPAPNQPQTIFEIARDVINLLEKLNIKKVHIVAHSFGCRVALLIASQTDLVGKMVLIGAAGLKKRFSFIKWLNILKYKFFKALVKLKIINKKFLERFGSEDYKKLTPVMKKTFVNIVNTDLTFVLKLIKAESLIIVGSKDKETPPYISKKLHRYIENSRLIILKNASHFCFYEKNNLIKLAYYFIKC